MIKITELDVNWRNIIHVTNTGNNCCEVGDRVPAIWVTCCSQTSLLISNSTPVNGDDFFFSKTIPLNTPIQVMIIWAGIYTYVYYDGTLVNTYYHGGIPIGADPNATVYIGDPWHAFDGYQIKDFIIKNS